MHRSQKAIPSFFYSISDTLPLPPSLSPFISPENVVSEVKTYSWWGGRQWNARRIEKIEERECVKMKKRKKKIQKRFFLKGQTEFLQSLFFRAAPPRSLWRRLFFGSLFLVLGFLFCFGIGLSLFETVPLPVIITRKVLSLLKGGPPVHGTMLWGGWGVSSFSAWKEVLLHMMMMICLSFKFDNDF